MGRRNKHKVERIPTLDTPDACHDWLDRYKPRPTVVRQWEVWYAWLGNHPYSSVQEGDRPVLIMSNDHNTRFSNTVTIIPFTTKMKRLELPSHVVIGRIDGWDKSKDSLALMEQMTTIDKRRLMSKVGEITDVATKEKLTRAVMAQLGLNKNFEEETE
ncbi:MAG: type II toxin-antitoxin system PemK/MazF family toxin [Clostridiales bacterium]|nr:type II toxin-antitoxin system PemK/MazF family toxin [Clostridiales bacterium]